MIDRVGTGSHRPIQHVGDEECRRGAVVEYGHIPRAIDGTAADGLDDIPAAIDDQEAARFHGGRGAVFRGEAADDHPAAPECDKGGRQANATRTGPRQFVWVQAGEQADRARGRNLHDGAAGALQIAVVVEVTDERIAGHEVPNGRWHHEQAIGIDVAILWHRRSDRHDGIERGHEGLRHDRPGGHEQGASNDTNLPEVRHDLRTLPVRPGEPKSAHQRISSRPYDFAGRILFRPLPKEATSHNSALAGASQQ